MLKFYLTTVVIWMIIIQSTILMFKDVLKKRIGCGKKKNGLIKRISNLFLLSAVPIFRLCIEIMIICFAICNQEDFDKMMEKYKNGQSRG